LLLLLLLQMLLFVLHCSRVEAKAQPAHTCRKSSTASGTASCRRFRGFCCRSKLLLLAVLSLAIHILPLLLLLVLVLVLLLLFGGVCTGCYIRQEVGCFDCCSIHAKFSSNMLQHLHHVTPMHAYSTVTR
jgi:hypothetical protein